MDSNRDGARADFGLFGVNLRLADRHILKDVTLTLHPGEFHALIGSRNSGKTAIASILSGQLGVSSGTVRLGGRNFGAVTLRQARQQGVCLVGGSPKVFPQLTVAESLLSGEAFWRRAFRSWRSHLREAQGWLDANGIDLPLTRTLDTLPVEDWIFVEILGRLLRSPGVLIMDEALENLSPARRRSLMPVLRKRMDAGLSVLWITHKIEDAMLMADRLSVLRSGKLLLSSRPEGLDQLNLIRLCYTQIEERDEIDTTMQQFHQLMRFTGALIRDLPQAVAILDTDGVVRFLNRRAGELFAAAGGGLGGSLAELLGGGNGELAAKIASAAAQDGDQCWHNVTVRRSGGGVLSDITLRRIVEHARPVGHMLQIEDVSAREELRRRMILSDNLASVGLLAAGVAHEVNNPLEILGNYLLFLKKKDADAESQRVIRKMEEEAARIQQIVRNLIVFSGDAGSRRSPVDLHGLCLELCELLRFHNKDRRIVFSCPPAGFEVLVRADANEMRQMLLNLFRNSIAAVRDGGRIQVSFAEKERNGAARVEMRFSDNGPGITLENPDEIFLPFVTTRAEGGKNHGLGLFIVYGIVEQYGGGIRAENAPEGGCVFTINLPLARREQ